MRTLSTKKALAALFALVLLLGACSSDGDGDDASDDEATTTTEEESDSTTTEEADDDVDIDITDDSLDVGDLGGLGDCFEFAAAYGTVFLGSLGAAFGDDDAVEEYQEQLGDLEASVPDEIADEFEILAEAYGEYFAALGDGGLLGDGAEEATELIESDEVVEAQDAIDAYLAEECS